MKAARWRHLAVDTGIDTLRFSVLQQDGEVLASLPPGLPDDIKETWAAMLNHCRVISKEVSNPIHVRFLAKWTGIYTQECIDGLRRNPEWLAKCATLAGFCYSRLIVASAERSTKIGRRVLAGARKTGRHHKKGSVEEWLNSIPNWHKRSYNELMVFAGQKFPDRDADNIQRQIRRLKRKRTTSPAVPAQLR